MLYIARRLRFDISFIRHFDRCPPAASPFTLADYAIFRFQAIFELSPPFSPLYFIRQSFALFFFSLLHID